MRSIKIKTIIFSLLVLLISLSGYLAYVNDIGSKEGICLIETNGNPTSCSDVQNSKYGELFGIKLCHVGLVVFSLLFLIFLYANFGKTYEKEAYKLFLILLFIGSMLALYFLYIQFFILKTLCSTCIIIDASTILVLTLAHIDYKGRWRGEFGFSP